MKEVIDQIAQIDEIAFKNEQSNKILLVDEEKKYQAKIQKYHEEKIREAHRLAQDVYIQIIAETRSEVSEKTSESQKKIQQLKMKSSLVEKDVIEKIFSEIFSKEKEG